jgi:hypothetical protein
MEVAAPRFIEAQSATRSICSTIVALHLVPRSRGGEPLIKLT